MMSERWWIVIYKCLYFTLFLPWLGAVPSAQLYDKTYHENKEVYLYGVSGKETIEREEELYSVQCGAKLTGAIIFASTFHTFTHVGR